MDIFKIKHFLLLLFVGLLYQTCQTPHQTEFKKNDSFAEDDLPDISDTLRNLTIKWEKKEEKVSHDVYFSEYGKIRRLSKDTILLIYHCGSKQNEWDNIAIRKSFDNGKTWLPAKIIVPDDDPRYYGFSTPDLLVLKNKWLVLSYAGRGKPDDSLHNNLQIRISKDHGETWGQPQIVSLGRSWEPGMIQLPDGEIELFYSNEILSTKKAKGNHEQKILMVSSNDNGLNWTLPKLVAFTPNIRDGMPVPVVLNDNKGIIFLIEVVENERSPEILWSSLKAKWNYKEIGNIDNGRRWSGSINPVWGGAPYLIQLPTGETIISMQTEGGRKIGRYTQWKKNTVVVMVGNSMAKNFGNITFPYPDLPIDQGRYFNSLFLKNDTTVTLITTFNLPSGRSILYSKDGHIYR